MKLLCTDIDGTLVGGARSGIPEINKQALQMLKERGVITAFCSGRPPRGIRPIAKALGVTGPLGAYGGALVQDENGKTLDSHPMDKDLALSILPLIRKENATIFLFDDDNWYCDQENQWTELEVKVSCAGTIVPSIEQGIRQVDHLFKLLAIDEDTEKLERIRQAILKQSGETIDSYLSHPNYLEIMRRGIDKGNAVQVLSKQYHVPQSQILAVGDFYNDMGMFRQAGISIAMGNAPEEVKKSATIVADTNVNGGFGKAIFDLYEA